MQIQIKNFEKIKWINIVKPEKYDLKKVLTENNLPEEFEHEILKPSLQTKAKYLNNSIYISLHFPKLNKEKVQNIEVDFLLNEKTILTSTYHDINLIEEHNNDLNNEDDVYVLFENLLKKIYSKANEEIESEIVEARLLEKMLFNENKENELVHGIIQHKNILFNFKSILKIHKNILQTYLEYSKIIWPESQNHEAYFNNEFSKLIYNLENQTDLLDEIRVTTDFLIEYKTKLFTKAFTVISFIILPLTLLAGIMGMNTKFPSKIVENEFGVLYILIFMFLVAIITTFFLKIKKFI